MNFLLIQLRRIGDVMMTTPAIRSLKKAYPKAKISFLTAFPSDQILKYNPHLEQVIVYPDEYDLRKFIGFIHRIRDSKYDYVIDFQGSSRTALLSWFSGSYYRIGFNFRARRWVYHQSMELTDVPIYSALHKLKLLEPLGVLEKDIQLEMPIGYEERHFVEKCFDDLEVQKNRLRVSVSPVSRQPYKIWPAAKFAKISDWLIKKYNAQVFFIHGPGEEHFVEAVKKEMNLKPMPPIGIPNLLQTRALLEAMHLHFGNDNGLRHLAIAGNIPTVAVFGRPNPVNWTPPDQKKHLYLENDPGCKSKCYYPSCEHLNCINDIGTENVKRMIQDALPQDFGINE